MENFEILKTKYNVLEYVVNYKNSDYTPIFFKNTLKTSEENFYKISIKCIFEVNNNLLINVNKLKEFLKQASLYKNDLEYDLFLESASDMEITEDNIIIIIFNCNGKIYKKRKIKTIRNNETINIDSVRDIRVNFSLNADTKTDNILKNVVINNMSFSFNTKEGFKIDSEKGKIIGLENWNFYEFPKTENKQLKIKLTGIEKIIVDYREEL